MTVNPRAPRSLARTREICSIAPFEATYDRALGRTVVEPVKELEKKMILPPAGMMAAAALAVNRGAFTLAKM